MSFLFLGTTAILVESFLLILNYKVGSPQYAVGSGNNFYGTLPTANWLLLTKINEY
jgi:hypothetical protein